MSAQLQIKMHLFRSLPMTGVVLNGIIGNVCKLTVAPYMMNVNKNLSNFNKRLLFVDNRRLSVLSEEKEGKERKNHILRIY